MSIEFPTPKFNFGDIVFILQKHVDVEYEKCPECFDGKLNVVGPAGQVKTLTCRDCSGSGRSYKQAARTETWTIDGMLQIDRVRCELGQHPRTFSGVWDGISYQGNVVWREDCKDSDSNVFSEKCLLSIDEVLGA